MSGSEYIRWAKSRERFAYNLGRSSIRTCPAEDLGARLEDLTLEASNAWGWPPLLRAIADRYGVDDSRVVLAVGCSMANHLVCSELLSAGAHVLVESPGYEPLRELPRLFGARVETFPRNAEDWSINVDEIERRVTPATRLVVLSDPHNPSGRLADSTALERLADLADRSEFHVLVDEVYREFIHRPGEPFAGSRGPRWISTSSLTKAYGLDQLRAGWIIASPELSERLRRRNDLFGIIMPHATERLALRALERVERLRNGVESLLAQNRPRVDAFVEARPELSWSPPDAGPVGFVRLERGGVAALQALLETDFDATITPGRFFEADDHFRIGFGMTPADLEAGLARLEQALDRLGPSRGAR